MLDHRKNIPSLRAVTMPERATSQKARESWQLWGIISEFVEATERLSEIRSNRVATMGGPKKRYAGLLDVYEELDEATAIHRRLACPVLDVSDLSVEETAMRVIKLVADRQRERKQKPS